ncbi:MAG TPA: hypothetical protein VLI06_09415 [Solimonas sp.]|nr:hypothetical protein [Solimonas sp.]
MRTFLLTLYILTAALVIWDENAATSAAEPAAIKVAVNDVP